LLVLLLLLLDAFIPAVDSAEVKSAPSMLRHSAGSREMLLLQLLRLLLLMMLLPPTRCIKALDGGRRAAAARVRACGFAVPRHSRHGRVMRLLLLL